MRLSGIRRWIQATCVLRLRLQTDSLQALPVWIHVNGPRRGSFKNYSMLQWLKYGRCGTGWPKIYRKKPVGINHRLSLDRLRLFLHKILASFFQNAWIRHIDIIHCWCCLSSVLFINWLCFLNNNRHRLRPVLFCGALFLLFWAQMHASVYPMIREKGSMYCCNLRLFDGAS